MISAFSGLRYWRLHRKGRETQAHTQAARLWRSPSNLTGALSIRVAVGVVVVVVVMMAVPTAKVVR